MKCTSRQANARARFVAHLNTRVRVTPIAGIVSDHLPDDIVASLKGRLVRFVKNRNFN